MFYIDIDYSLQTNYYVYIYLIQYLKVVTVQITQKEDITKNVFLSALNKNARAHTLLRENNSNEIRLH